MGFPNLPLPPNPVELVPPRVLDPAAALLEVVKTKLEVGIALNEGLVEEYEKKSASLRRSSWFSRVLSFGGIASLAAGLYFSKQGGTQSSIETFCALTGIFRTIFGGASVIIDSAETTTSKERAKTIDRIERTIATLESAHNALHNAVAANVSPFVLSSSDSELPK